MATAGFDLVVNNADRKAGALIADPGGFQVIDHGLTCHDEDKLRSVFWGFGGDRLEPQDEQRLHRVLAGVEDGELRTQLQAVLPPDEVDAVELRTAILLEDGHLPVMPFDRHALPWPIW